MLPLSIFNASATFKKFIVFGGKCGSFAGIYLYAKKNMSCRGTPSDTTVAETRGKEAPTISAKLCKGEFASDRMRQKMLPGMGRIHERQLFAVCIHRKGEGEPVSRGQLHGITRG